MMARWGSGKAGLPCSGGEESQRSSHESGSGMLKYLLANSELKGLLEFVSPQFWSVAQPLHLISVANRLAQNRKDLERWGQRKQGLLDPKGGRPVDRTDEAAAVGRAVLEHFFRQILESSTWILDFRPDAFPCWQGSSLVWSPQVWFYDVSPEFAEGIRGVYRGFYGGDDALFLASLKALGLESATEAFRAHFGAGDQSAVDFRLKTFQATFGKVFEACAGAGVKLHPDFFVLGISLLTLYENLESLKVPLDVRGAFQQALQPKNP